MFASMETWLRPFNCTRITVRFRPLTSGLGSPIPTKHTHTLNQEQVSLNLKDVFQEEQHMPLGGERNCFSEALSREPLLPSPASDQRVPVCLTVGLKG